MILREGAPSSAVACSASVTALRPSSEIGWAMQVNGGVSIAANAANAGKTPRLPAGYTTPWDTISVRAEDRLYQVTEHAQHTDLVG
jgi:hypothetical protein